MTDIRRQKEAGHGFPKQRRLYAIRTSPEGVEWAGVRVDQVQHHREWRRRNGTKTRRGIGARWWKVFPGCCKNVVREQETSIRDSTTQQENSRLPEPWRLQS